MTQEDQTTNLPTDTVEKLLASIDNLTGQISEIAVKVEEGNAVAKKTLEQTTIVRRRTGDLKSQMLKANALLAGVKGVQKGTSNSLQAIAAAARKQQRKR